MVFIQLLSVLRAVALGAALWLAAAGALALPPLQLDPAAQPVPLGDHAEVWVDAGGSARVEQVAGEPALRWRPAVAGEIHQVDTRTALWLRFRLAPTPQAQRWYLEVPFPAVDRVTLYTPDGAGRWRAQSAGDHIAVADWPVPYRHPVLPIATGPAGSSTFYLRVTNRGNFSAPLRFVEESQLGAVGHGVTLVLGMYFGLALVAVAFSLAGAFWMRERTHALYALAVVLMALTQAAMTGVGGAHLWPRWPLWNELSTFVLPVLTMAAFLLFFTALLSVQERSRSFHRALLGIAALSLPLAALIPLLAANVRFALMAGYVVVGALASAVAVGWAWQRGDRYAPWVFAAMLPVAVGCALPLARGAGLLPMGTWSIHGMQLALALEIPLLLLVLLQRSQRQREYSRRMQGLDRLDPATGLINASVFHERLVRLIARSQRLKIRSAVLLVDIANLDAIQRAFGRELAREMPLRVSGRLLSVARNIDSVARLGEHRFGLLLEGPLKADEVAQAAPRIIARCLMPYRKRPLEWTPRLRIAQALIPMDGDDADTLLLQLEALLAEPSDAQEAGSVRTLGPLPHAPAARSRPTS